MTNRITRIPSFVDMNAGTDELIDIARVAVAHQFAFRDVYEAVLWNQPDMNKWWTQQDYAATNFLGLMESIGFDRSWWLERVEAN